MPRLDRNHTRDRHRVAPPRRTGATVAAAPLRHWHRVPPSRAPIRPDWLVRASRAALAADPAERQAAERAILELLETRYEAEEAFLTDSGTTALALALSVALRAQGGSRVALPAYTCFSVAAATAAARGEAFLYDLEPETLSPSPPSVEDALRNGIQVVVACPLYGYPLDVPSLMEQAGRHGAIVVEDAAQGAAGTFRGRPPGAFAPLSVLSFGRGKGLTCGGGGALIVRDPGLVSIARAAVRRLLPARAGWKELGQVAGEWIFGRPGLYGIPASLPFLRLGETRYEPAPPGRRLASGAALLLREALGNEPDADGPDRRRRAEALREELARVDRVMPIRPVPYAVSGELRLPFLLAGRSGGGIPNLGVMPGYPARLDEIPAFRRHVFWTAPSLSGSARLVRSLATAPTHAWVPKDLGARLVHWAGAPAGPDETPDRSGSVPSIQETPT